MSKKRAKIPESPEEGKKIFFHKTNEKESPVEGQVDKSTRKQEYKRKTYYFRPDQIQNIRAYSFYNELDKSEVVRRAIDEFFERNPITPK